jgi:hypothetical protein
LTLSLKNTDALQEKSLIIWRLSRMMTAHSSLTVWIYQELQDLQAQTEQMGRQAHKDRKVSKVFRDQQARKGQLARLDQQDQQAQTAHKGCRVSRLSQTWLDRLQIGLHMTAKRKDTLF